MAQVKTKDEIKKIAKACLITDAIFATIIKNFCFSTEIQLRDFILGEIKKRGLKPSFPPIVTSGPRAGNEIHPQSTNAELKGFTIIDMGVVYEKYMSDMTRMIYVSYQKGKPTDKEKALYTKLLASQVDAINKVKAGVKCAALDAGVRECLGKDAKYFIHTLGHGVGTRIHEDPKIFYKLTKPVLKEGMVITIEPGLYIKRTLGMRIEDTLLVTKKGCKILTKSPKELIYIKR